MEIVDSIWFSQTTGSKSNHNYCLKLSPQKKTHCFRSMVLDSFRGMQCADNFVITTDTHCKNFRDDFKMVIAMITKLTMIWHHCCDDGLIWFISPQINLINMLQVKRSNLQPLWPWWLHLREWRPNPIHIPQKKSYLWGPALQSTGWWWFGCIYLQLHKKNKK